MPGFEHLNLNSMPGFEHLNICLQNLNSMPGPPRKPCFQPPVARSSQDKSVEPGQPGWLEVFLDTNSFCIINCDCAGHGRGHGQESGKAEGRGSRLACFYG